MQPIRIGVDTGGTFTDVVLLPPDGGPPVVHKLLSTPDDPSRAVLEGIAGVLKVNGARVYRPASLGDEDSDAGVNTRAPQEAPTQVTHGSTVATNALLEGKGGRVAFVTTAGFEDLLWLRRQNRPDLYALEPVVPQPLVQHEDCFGVDERMGPNGAAVQPLDRDELDRLCDWLQARIASNERLGAQASSLRTRAEMPALPVSAVVVCLLHSYANPGHEQAIATLLRERLPQLHLTVSSELLPEFREYERAATCVVNGACAAPMLGYLGKLGSGLTVQGSRVETANRSQTHEPLLVDREPSLRIMASHGGTIPVAAVADVPARTVLSGPAGGVLGALAAASAAGVTRFLSHDMGGTSTDVALCNAAPAMTQAAEIAGLPLKLPMLDIHTVGAGGGSIAWVDAGGMLRVGPQSLGADPGPACYGKQSAPYIPAVTDAHVVLGHIPAETRLGGTLELDVEAARAAVDTIAQQLGLPTEEAAAGILRVAAAEVARALRRMSVERGEDPRDYCLLPFGGMGGLHAAELADQLGMRRILLPPHPGLLSAVGMLSAPAKYFYSRSMLLALPEEAADLVELTRHLETAQRELQDKAEVALAADGIETGEQHFAWSVDLRYRGQSHEVTIPFDDALEAADGTFETEHLRLYGYQPATGIELVTLRLEARGPAPVVRAQYEMRHCAAGEQRTARVWRDGGWEEWPVIGRGNLGAEDELAGPALLTEYSATTLVPPGWQAVVTQSGAITLDRQSGRVRWPAQGEEGKAGLKTRAPADEEAALKTSAPSSPVALSIFRHLYASIADEMGSRLMRSAFSPNIKERRDFSCAVFLADGQMLAQAAHIPVHLGSMPLSVAAVLERYPAAAMQPGDVFVVNDPFSGGTHLPDITVVAPVFVGGNAEPQFLAANRAHHADIGGISPGSMPLSRSIHDEGIQLEPQRLDASCIERICAASRTPEERRGDLQAQLAALSLGQSRLTELVEAHGLEECLANAARLLDYSERCMREALRSCVGADGCPPGELSTPEASATRAHIRAPLPAGPHKCGPYEFTDYLDDDGFGGSDIKLHCSLTIADGEAVVDLRDCDPQVCGPMNAVHAIAVSAALYCFRCLAQRLLPGVDTPENAGLGRPIRVLTQPGTVVDALPPAAVAAGNVETSQRLVDVIFGAMAQQLPEVIPAASGGSMNNVTVGSRDGAMLRPTLRESADLRAEHCSAPTTAFAYYETLACGSGGGPQRAGASGIHTHMTNTLNTPVEALEHAFPLRVVSYRLRRGSGGAGQHTGGDGIVRRYRALEPCTATLLTERRVRQPCGLRGGEPGQAGQNTLFRADGSVQQLGGKASVELLPGDELEIATPGGGGWGAT